MSRAPAPPAFELEVTEGLESLAADELRMVLGVRPAVVATGKGWLRFPYAGPGQRLLDLRLAESVFAAETFAVPRPRALLGDAHFKRLRSAITQAVAHYPQPPATFTIAAAGAESSVMLRLRAELAQATGLADGDDKGDLQIRLLRERGGEGWDALIRLTPRPLSARAWRVCSFPGALNATVACAMARLTRPQGTDTFVNLMSGSASIMIERLETNARTAVGVEIDMERLECARRNVRAANLEEQVHLLQGDARQIPLPSGSVDALCADLPFGQRVGRHDENTTLYPQVFSEAARVARRGARFAAITHEVKLIESVLAHQSAWHLRHVFYLTLRGLHPRLYVLERA